MNATPQPIDTKVWERSETAENLSYLLARRSAWRDVLANAVYQQSPIEVKKRTATLWVNNFRRQARDAGLDDAAQSRLLEKARERVFGGRAGVAEQIARKDVTDPVPVVNALVDTDELIMLYSKASRLERLSKEKSPDAANEMRALTHELRPYIAEMEYREARGDSFAGQATTGVMDLAGYMAEFALTGGLAQLATKGATRLASKALGKAAKTMAGKMIRQLGVWGARAGVRTATVGIPGAARGALQAKIPAMASGPEGVEVRSGGTSWGGAVTRGATAQLAEYMGE